MAKRNGRKKTVLKIKRQTYSLRIRKDSKGSKKKNKRKKVRNLSAKKTLK